LRRPCPREKQRAFRRLAAWCCTEASVDGGGEPERGICGLWIGGGISRKEIRADGRSDGEFALIYQRKVLRI
jgi:hypothetical protein